MFENTTPELDDQTGTQRSDWTGFRGDTLFFTIAKNPLTGWGSRTWTGHIKLTAASASPASTFTITNSSNSSLVSVYFQWDSSLLPVGKYFYYIKWQDSGLGLDETSLWGKITSKQGDLAP